MKKIFTLFFFLIFLIVSGIYCNSEREKETLTYRNLSDSVHYAGMKNCRQCHENIYQTFIETGMGQSFEKASKKKSAANFKGHPKVYDTYKDFYYKPYWQGDSLKIMEFRLRGKDTVHKRIQSIQYIIGSGQHTNSHIYESDGYLFQAPLTYYTQKGTWDLPPGYENGANSRFDRIIGLECLSCHNAYPTFVEGSENKYAEVPQGIDCERCHGPGSLHIKEKKAGKIVDITKEIDYSIVNPGKLSTELQFEVCQRCHLQGNAVLKGNHSFFDFKPGMRLTEVMDVFMPEFRGADNEFIMASHVERLKMSKCYLNTLSEKENSKKLSCISCHNPHVSVKKTNPEVFNTSCKKCHSESTAKNTLCGENKQKRLTVKDDCVSCHMVKSGTIDIPHVTSTDHYIRKPKSKREIDSIKEFVRLRCINNPNPAREDLAKAYINYYEKFTSQKEYLDSAKKYLDNKGEENIRKNYGSIVHIYYLKQEYREIIKYAELIHPLSFLNRKTWSNEDAYTCYRTGDAYYNAGDYATASLYFERAIELAPKIPLFKNRYGNALMNTGKTKQAKKLFEEISLENRNYVSALSNLGYVYLREDNDTEKALNLYERALKLDPDYETAILNKAGLYIYMENFTFAKEILRQYALKKPDNKQVMAILESIKNKKDRKNKR